MLERGRWLIVAVLVLIPVALFAQTTGTVQGQVTDRDGAALPGVTLSLTGDPIQGAERIALTDPRGVYRFSALPVGVYSLTASLEGFAPRAVSNVRVTIDGVASVNFELSMAALTEEVQVTADAPLVDRVSSSVSANYDSEFIEALPTRNSFFDILSVAPGVSAPSEGSAMLAAYGGNVTSQQWNIDGLNLAAPEGGWLGWTINPDIVKETSLKGFGAGAEYGSTMGNVYNMVTKSGTNDLGGSLAVYLQPDSLVDPNVTLDRSNLFSYRLWDPAGEYTIDQYYDARGTLGGPIIQDKLWFFAGAQLSNVNVVGPTGVPGLDGTGTKDQRYDVKLTTQMGDNHRLDFRGHTATGDVVPAPDIYTALSAVLVSDIDTSMFTTDYNGVLSDSTLLNVRAGTWSREQKMDSRTGSDEEWLQDATYPGPPLNLGGIFWFNGRKEDYKQIDVVGSHLADQFIAGGHEFKFGVQYNEGSGERRAAKSSFVWKQPPNPGFTDPFWSFRYQINPPLIYGANTETKALFVQDKWTVNSRLAIDIGLRYDDQTGYIPDFPRLDAAGNPTSETIPGADMIQWKNWAPRVGLAWQPTGDGRTVLRGFYGRYWDGPVSAAWYYPPPGRGNSEVWFVSPWQFRVSSQPAAPPDQLLADGVKNPYTDQFAFSFDQQIGQDAAIGGQLMLKSTNDMIGWQIEGDGECKQFLWDDPWTAGVTEQIPLCEVTKDPTRRKGNGPGAGSLAPDAKYHIDYQGAILTYRKRYSKTWDLMASYTYSKTEGINPRPHENGAGGQGVPAFSTDSGSDPSDWYNAEHLLQGDRTHMFRVQSNVSLPWDLLASGVLNVQSGRPYLRLAQVVGPTTGQALTVTVDADEGLRMPAQTILDFGLQKTFGLQGAADLSLGLQVLNALNEDAEEFFSTWTLFAGQQFAPSSWVSPRRLQIKAKLTF